MIRINLLPFRAARKKENIRRQVSIFILSFAFIIIALVWYNIYLNGKVKELNGRVAEMKIDLKRYEDINAKIKKIKSQLAMLEKKTNVIKQLDKNRFEPVQLLDTMSAKVIAKRMWLTSLSAKGNKVSMSGIALDNQTIADFMTRLESSDFFKSVTLKTIKLTKLRGTNMKSFSLTCTKMPEASTAKKTATKAKKAKKK
jgi:type IV pilus assembly protein PilN